ARGVATAAGPTVVPFTTVRHGGGRLLDFEYGPDGSVAAVRHSGGAVLRTPTDPRSGRVTELRLEAGDTVVPVAAYRYSDAGDLLAVADASGAESRYTYDQAHRLLSWTDRNGVSYHHRYDELGRCVAQVGTGGVYANAFVYGADGLPDAPPGGRWTVLVETVRELDASPTGLPAGFDPEPVLDALCAMPAVAEIARRGPRAAADRSTAREDRAFGRLRLLVFRADARGDVWQIIDPVGGVRTFDRDAAHQVVREVDPSGAVTGYTRDRYGLITAVTTPDGASTTITRGRWGEPLREVGPGGRTWTYESDELGNTVAVVGPDGARERYDYEARREGSVLRRVIDPTGAVTEIDCDGNGLPILVRAPGDRVWTYERDAFGRLTALTDPLGRTTGYTWTPTGKPLTRRNPDGTVLTWTYDAEGNELARTDEAGNTATTAYTVLDAPSEVTGADGAVLRIAYDTQMQITSVTNPSGLVWRYEYDDAGRLIAETDYNGARTTYVHDSAGRIRATTDATGRMTRFVYDVSGRVVEEHTDDGVTTYRYDRHGDLVEAANPDAIVRFTRDAAGRVLTERIGDITVAVDYDRAGRRTQRIVDTRAVPGAGLGRRTVFTRDETGLLAGVASDDGHGPADLVRFGYDRGGNEIARAVGAAVVDRRYDERDRIIAQHVRAGGGVVAGRTWTYRSDGYVTGGQDLLRGAARVELDPAGRITAATADRAPIPPERYGYDRAGVLTLAPDADEPARTGPVASAGTLVTELGRRRYRYDAAGRLVRVVRTRLSHKPEVFEFTHTATGQIRTVAAPDGTVWRYGYDAFGRRVSKVRTDRAGTVSHTVVFGWDGDELVFQQDRAAGPTPSITEWHWVHHPETGEPLTQYSRTHGAPAPASHPAHAGRSAVDTEFYAIVTDLAGAPTELIDPRTGAVAGWASATVWGRTWWNGHAATALRFAGQYHDAETGLHYNRHRYYDPVTAAYTTPDPLGLAPNPADAHAYVHNPHTWVDPLGLASCGRGWWRTLRTFGPIGAARQEYVDTVRGITERGLARVAAGEDAATVARWAIDERNAMKTATRAKLPRVLNIWAERRNIRHYGDPVGPTYEFLHDVRGKTPMDIIKGAGRTSARVNRLLGVR
ncbi:RHS repeat-associated core domain-containing protein, partial [Nocardia farcinica]|uniref:RHS repeat-associated core domain-containing protein n=1 Tax=Nocardia farcinica TaxID=37329 RepID=UPI0024551530